MAVSSAWPAAACRTSRRRAPAIFYVRVRVVLPTGLDDADRERLRAFTSAIKQPDPRTGGPSRGQSHRPTATDPAPGATRS